MMKALLAGPSFCFVIFQSLKKDVYVRIGHDKDETDTKNRGGTPH
jgi:hypothetical protein